MIKDEIIKPQENKIKDNINKSKVGTDVTNTDATKKCNCNDEFKTETCPIHYNNDVDKFNKEVVVISDDNMVEEQIRQWAGYAYYCPRCGEASILDIMKYCGNCGVGIVLQSAKLTAFINELTERNKK